MRVEDAAKAAAREIADALERTAWLINVDRTDRPLGKRARRAVEGLIADKLAGWLPPDQVERLRAGLEHAAFRNHGYSGGCSACLSESELLALLPERATTHEEAQR